MCKLESFKPLKMFFFSFCLIFNQLNKVINYYHKNLKYKHDNQFAQQILAKTLTDASESPRDMVYKC